MRRQIRRILLAAGALASAGVAGWYLARTSSGLLDRATRLKATTGLILADYHWVSADEIVTRRRGADYIGINVHSGVVHAFQIANPVVSQRLFGWPSVPAISDDTLIGGFSVRNRHRHVSPNGQWLLAPFYGRKGLTYDFAVSTDGSASIRWEHLPSEAWFACWFCDNRHWAAIHVIGRSDAINDAILYEHDREAPKIARELLLPAWKFAAVLASLPDNRLAAMQVTQPGDRIDVVEYNLKTNPATPTTHSIKLPYRFTGRPVVGGPPYECAVAASPDGATLGWEFLRYNAIPGPPLIQRLLSLVGRHDTIADELWTSRLDGSEMRQVGALVVPPGQKTLDDLDWTPDAKRISFRYDGALWTVPAN